MEAGVVTAAFLHASQAELSVLGAVMLYPPALAQVRGTLEAEHLHDPRHRLIYEAMCALAGRGETIDAVTLATVLEKAGTLALAGGADYLWTLSDAAGSARAIEHHARIVRNFADVRMLQSRLAEVDAAASAGDFDTVDDLVASGFEALSSVAQGRNLGNITTLQKALTSAIARVEAAFHSKGALVGTPTGFKSLDNLIGGMEGGQLIILAARPAMGKTALAVNLAVNAAAAGSSVAVFSLEMPADQLGMRVLCSRSMVPFDRIKTGALSDGDIDRMLSQVKKLKGLSMPIDDTAGVGVAYVRQVCTRLNADPDTPPLGLVVIDYLQLMKGSVGGKGSNREQEIASITRDLKTLAKSLDVPVVCLSQLNRGVESRADKRPLMSDLRESGAIEQDADIILMLYRDEYYDPESAAKGKAEIICRKQRAGATGTVVMDFDGARSRWSDAPDGGWA